MTEDPRVELKWTPKMGKWRLTPGGCWVRDMEMDLKLKVVRSKTLTFDCDVILGPPLDEREE